MSPLPSSYKLSQQAAGRIYSRIDELALISESSAGLTRRFATPEHLSANALVREWMESAGMSVHQDAIGNMTGRYPAAASAVSNEAIVIGSHLDTVINAGRFDGMLGVLSGIACVESLFEAGVQLNHPVEVIAFADEEGVRFQSTYLGSRAITGEFDAAVMSRTDADGISFSDALQAFNSGPDDIALIKREPKEMLAYLELHIEQGPVLQSKNVPVGVVSTISGATRLMIQLTGEAGHAGTVPMDLRRDALVAASHCIGIVETRCQGHDGLVGTVGHVNVEPGAGNVIPGSVQFSVDIRAAEDDLRTKTVSSVIADITSVCEKRNITIEVDRVHEAPTIPCNTQVVEQLEFAVAATGYETLTLPSGAGHDAAAMASITDVGMLFVRCKDGLSHHPDEFVTENDAIAGANVLMEAVIRLSESRHENS